MQTPGSPVSSRPPSRPATPSGQSQSQILHLSPHSLLRPTNSSASLRSRSAAQVHTLASRSTTPALPSNLHASLPVATSSASATSSPSSSDIRGIVTQNDEESPGEGDQDIAEGTVSVDDSLDDVTRKQQLRDHLRQTLAQKGPSGAKAASSAEDAGMADELHRALRGIYPVYVPRQYFVLTDAGKPVFVSRSDKSENDASSDDMTSGIGVMQALISVFADNGDKLRSIISGTTRMTFVLRSPLYYVYSASSLEPECVARSHLEYLHLQILSIVTAAQIKKIFQRRSNFDLSRLMSGSTSMLTGMVTRLQDDLGTFFSSLSALRMDSSLRTKAAESIVPPTKMSDMLYTILLVKNQVVSLVRPRKHSIHPADLHILLNTLAVPSLSSSVATASWIPICLPKYNPQAFLHAYISYLNPEIELTLISICGGREMEAVREWSDQAVQRLKDEGTLLSLEHAARRCEYGVGELSIPGLRHFVYKSRQHIQITSPVFESPYDEMNGRQRLIRSYQILFDSIHAKSGQSSTLKLQSIQTEHENLLAWITQPFELYVALSPNMSKSAMVGAANAVARWVRKEEVKLFLRDAPVF
ncbi:DUF254-domain-containing protein [Sistotremastrum suecicum HHB10207 ss-3]|uniref:Vacuolar fusion protein MON1 n=1 Tax=Sistotremastrum suecicum HHB10207 ss-3 TaxID=1314776 RepID=A0A166IIA7_9AGAM|nr:DUF254-domain-containing protein [Sistotremastrum suecicum HHB10207 ss-3]